MGSPSELLAAARTELAVLRAAVEAAHVVRGAVVALLAVIGLHLSIAALVAVTIAGATVISLLVSLTLSPALAAILLKPHEEPKPTNALTAALVAAGDQFNRAIGLMMSLKGQAKAMTSGIPNPKVITGPSFEYQPTNPKTT